MNISLRIIILLFLFEIDCKILPITHLYPLSDYANFIYKLYSRKHEGFVGIVLNDKGNPIVDEICRNIHYSETNTVLFVNVQSRNARQQIEKMEKQNIFMGNVALLLIFLNYSEKISEVLENIQYLPMYQTQSKMLIILSELPNNKQLQNIFSQCWKKKLLNVVAIFVKDKIVQVYTFNPFWKEKFLENFTETRYNANIYYNKLINLNKYPLKFLIRKDGDVTKVRLYINKTGAVSYGGNDVRLMKNLVDRMNGTLDVVYAEDFLKPGERNPWRHTNKYNSQAVSIKKRIIKEEHIDILNSEELVLDENLLEEITSLYPHAKDDLVIVMFNGKKIPYCVYLFLVFSSELWCVVFLVLLIVILFWMIIVRMLKVLQWKSKLIHIFQIMTGEATGYLPATHSERVFILFWILYSLLLANGFQSNLTSILMKPKYFTNIDSLQELCASGLNVRSFQTRIHELDKTLNGTSSHELVKRMIPIPACFDKVNNTLMNNTNFLFQTIPVLTTHNLALYYTKSRAFYEDNRPILYIVKESPLPQFIAFNVVKKSPYLNELDETLRRMQEVGLITFWTKQLEYEDVLEEILIPQDHSTNKNELSSVTFMHLESAFLILTIGLFSSTLVFFIEKYKNILLKI